MRKNQFRTFKDAKTFVISLKFGGVNDWYKFCKDGKRPRDIPRQADRIYADKWKGWGDFLGTGTLSPSEKSKQFRTFEEAKKIIKKYQITSQRKWFVFCKSGKKPDDIPAAPDRTYKKKWISWGDFLGTGTLSTSEKSKQFRTFENARKFVHSLKISKWEEWNTYCKSGKKPKDIPATSDKVYKDEWISWGDWLGTGYVHPRSKQFRTFEEAKKFVHELKLKRRDDWNVYCKSGDKPSDIPANPHIYKNKWISWQDWLGSNTASPRNKSKQWLPLREAKIEARKLVKQLGIKTIKDWEMAHKSGKIPFNLPKYPLDIYYPKSERNQKAKRK